MIEIERKFIVQNLNFLEDLNGVRISQGYLNDDPSRAVRVRIKGDDGFITVLYLKELLHRIVHNGEVLLL